MNEFIFLNKTKCKQTERWRPPTAFGSIYPCFYSILHFLNENISKQSKGIRSCDCRFKLWQLDTLNFAFWPLDSTETWNNVIRRPSPAFKTWNDAPSENSQQKVFSSNAKRIWIFYKILSLNSFSFFTNMDFQF